MRLHHLSPAIFLSVAASASAQSTAPSYDIATFKKEYPPAAAKLAEAYSHVRIVGTAISYYPQATGAAETMRESREELLCSDGAIRRISTNLKSTDARWPPGSMTIDIGSANHVVSCYRVGPDGYWQTTRSILQKDFTMARLVLSPAFVAYCLDNDTLQELLKIGNRQIVSVAPISIDGKEAIEMITDLHYEVRKESHLMREHFYFQPRSWALLGRTIERGPLTVHSKITYDSAGPDGIPRLRSIEHYEEHAATPDTKEEYGRFDVTSLEFVTTPKEQFEPAALIQFGAKDIADIYAPDTEPAATTAPAPLPLAASPTGEQSPSGHALLWPAAIAAILLAAGGTLFALRGKARHKR